MARVFGWAKKPRWRFGDRRQQRTARGIGFAGFVTLAFTVLAFGCRDTGLPSESEANPSESTASAAQPLAPASGVLNGSFEVEPQPAGTWPILPVVPGWQVAGSNWYLHTPVAGGQWPATTDQAQYILLGANNSTLMTLRQQVGTVRASTRYTALGDFNSTGSVSRARFSLKAFDGTTWTSLATTPWPTTPPATTGWKRDLKVQVDTTSTPSTLGQALYIVVETDPLTSTFVDNIRFDLRPLGPANRLVNPSFETPVRVAGDWINSGLVANPTVGWVFAGDTAWQFRPKPTPTTNFENPPADGLQWVWIGQNDWLRERKLSQAVGPIQSNTLYTFRADVCPRHDNSLGSLRLIAKGREGNACQQVVAESPNWINLPFTLNSDPCWSPLSVSVDSADHPELVGRELSVQIRNTQYSGLADNTSLMVDSDRLTAHGPQPPDGSANNPVSTTLRWRRGTSASATSGSEVFFSSSWSQVASRSTAARKGFGTAVVCPGDTSGLLKCDAYTALGTLANGTYYWAVDTINGTSRLSGSIWRFIVGPDPNPPPPPAPDGDQDGDGLADCDEANDFDPWTDPAIFNGMQARAANRCHATPSCDAIDTLAEVNACTAPAGRETKNQAGGWNWQNPPTADICNAAYGFHPNWSTAACGTDWQVNWAGYIKLENDGQHCFRAAGDTNNACGSVFFNNATTGSTFATGTECFNVAAGAYPIRWFYEMAGGPKTGFKVSYCFGGAQTCEPTQAIPTRMLRATLPQGTPDVGCMRAEHGGSDYYFCNIPRTREDARQRCASVGLSLARIDTAAENAWIDQQSASNRWIGGSDAAVEGNWVWPAGSPFWQGDSTGARVAASYTNWASGQPNNSAPSAGQDCVKILSGGQWDDADCAELEPFVCESQLISNVTVTPQQLCKDQSVRVQVAAADPFNPSSAPVVTINGAPTADSYDQFVGEPGPRLIPITVRSESGKLQSVLAQVDVVDCGAQAPELPLLYADFDLFDAGTVNFTVRNAPSFEDPTTRYIWTFGDGITSDTSLASVSHRYVAPAGDQEHQVFHVGVTVRRTGFTDVSATRTFVIWDNYNIAKRRGVLEPPVGVIDEVFVREGSDLTGDFMITNRESSALSFTRRRIDRMACDPNTPDVLGTEETVSLAVSANTTQAERLRVPEASLGAGICGVTAHYWGQTASGKPAQVSVSMDRPGLLGGAAVAPETADMLNYLVAQGLVSNPHRITEEEISKLYRQRKIRFDATNQVFYQSAPPPENSRGWCDPDAPGTPPDPQYECRPTGGWHVDTPGFDPEGYIANARKGDTLLVRSCSGYIKELIGRLTPPQLFTHTGIMTQNRFEIRQSTGEQAFLREKPNGVLGQPSDGFQEYYLRYLWPGTLTSRAQQAFVTGKDITDPNGEARKVQGFTRSEARCSGDSNIVWPRVVKPAPEFELAVRPTLQAAAEAAKGINGHYRFHSYSQATDTPAGDPNGPDSILDASGNPQSWGRSETVCSSFVRLALKGAGVTLDADKNLPLPSSVDLGPPDGIFHYTADERKAAGKALYSSIYNGVKMELEILEAEVDDYWYISAVVSTMPGIGVLGPVGFFGTLEAGNLIQWTTDAPDDVASQVTNCFASDFCSEDAKDSDDWEEPGEGFAVSPDDIMNHYDPPFLNASGQNIGGVYGYSETLVYRGKRYRPQFAWLPASGTRTVTGSVYNRQDDGSFIPVAGAFVEIQGVGDRTAITDASGRFTIAAVPAGSLSVYASHSFPQPSGPDQFREGRSCYVLADPNVPEGLLNQVSCDDFNTVLATNLSEVRVDLIGPPEAFRHVVISGSVLLEDCDCCGFLGLDPCYDRARPTFLRTCDVSPIEPLDNFAVGPAEMCVDEVGMLLAGTCELLPDFSVRVRVLLELHEAGGGSCGGNEQEDELTFERVVPMNASLPAGPGQTLQNVGVCGPSDCSDFGREFSSIIENQTAQ